MPFKIEPAGKGTLALEAALSSYDSDRTSKAGASQAGASQPNLAGASGGGGCCGSGGCQCSQQARKCQSGACDCCG